MGAPGMEAQPLLNLESENKLSFVDKTTLGAAVLAFGLELTPANEEARAFVGALALEQSHNPLVAGAAIGIATIAIEGVAGITTAAAMHLPSERMQRLIDKARERIEKKVSKPQTSAAIGDSLVALGIGAPALVVKKHLQEAGRTYDQDKKTVAKATGAIAVVSAGIGTMLSGGLEYAEKVGLEDEAEAALNLITDWRVFTGTLVATGGFLAIKNRLAKLREKKPFIAREIITDKEIQEALALEQEVWDIKEYGSLDVYKKYIPQSRIFAAFDSESKKCIGIARLFSGQPELPPFVGAKEMKFYNPAQEQEIIEGCISGETEEFGTVAVHPDAPSIDVNLELCRLAYRDAYERGIKKWGVIMEPRRVKAMNWRYGFTFEQVGPAVDYQGGDCAPHIMDLEGVRHNMKSKKPERFDWFVNEPLR